MVFAVMHMVFENAKLQTHHRRAVFYATGSISTTHLFAVYELVTPRCCESIFHDKARRQ
jgi:hypothetical protein